MAIQGEEDFWAPAVTFGDCQIFLNDVLHRTNVDSRMEFDRLRIEYRIIPAS